jgi:colanic acid/amylovoran biosynthesis glycosyltransferase
MRVAIATGSHAKLNETQIVYHIERLFGGASAIIAISRADPDPFGLPVLIVRDRLASQSPRTQFHLWCGMIRSMMEYGTSRVPYGDDRRRIAAFVNDNSIHAVLCEFGTVALALAPILHTLGLPVFAYYRGADVSAYLNNRRRIESYRRMMPHLAGVFSVSRYLLDRLSEQGIVHPNSHVVPSGVDTALFVPGPKDPLRCLAVGRFIEKKRPDLTVQAFCTVAQAHPGAVLEMIGEGPMLERCRQLAGAAGMGNRVLFHGQKPHDFVRTRMAESTVFLQHSVTGRDGNTEGMPTSVQEAMSCGMVVVSTRHAGIPEAVEEGWTGFLVNEGDQSGYAAALDRALGDIHGMTEMGLRAREIALARFDRTRMLGLIEATMRKALDMPTSANR